MSGTTYNAWCNTITKQYYDALLTMGKRDMCYSYTDHMGNTHYFLRDKL